MKITELIAAVESGLRGRRLREFTIESLDEGLVLQGKAPSFYVKQLAQSAVQNSTTRSVYRNEIEVD